MLTSRSSHLFQEETKGDGNCLFNAIILGLSRQSVIENLERGFTLVGDDPDISMKEFIRSAADKLNIPSRWSLVKKELAQLRQQSKLSLQNYFAPILRNLAIDLAEKDSQHKIRTIEPLISAFDDYVESRNGRRRSVVEDDIFKRHEFIQRKFAELYGQINKSNNINEELRNWWLGINTEIAGHHQFLQEMKKEGVWAGDLEGFQLARYFRVNLDAFHEDYVHRIYSHSGVIPGQALSNEQIEQLIVRQIINVPSPEDEGLSFLPLTEEKLIQRLGAVPEFEKVSWYIMENEFIKGFAVPSDWSDSLPQLWQRNVVEKKGDRYVFCVDRPLAMRYAAGMPEHKKILNIWRELYCEVPTLLLRNKKSVHWSNMLPAAEAPTPAPTNSLVYDCYQTFMSFVTDKFFSKPTIRTTPLFFKESYDDKKVCINAATFDIESRRHLDL